MVERSKNPYEDAARLAKVVKLVSAAQATEIDSSQVARMDNSQWSMLEQIAGVTPASQATRDLTVQTMRNVEAARARTRSPFPKYGKEMI